MGRHTIRRKSGDLPLFILMSNFRDKSLGMGKLHTFFPFLIYLKMNKKWISSVALSFVCAGVFAQEKEQKKEVQQLEEVVVTDSRFALKRENSGKTVIKITAKELERSQGKSLAEIINTKSGFEVNGSRSNSGQNITSFVRGGNNRQVLILIDGVQLSDPSSLSGEYDLRLIPVDLIESVEIIKGAASTLYGNGAATAVINITTKKASDKKIAAAIRSSVGTNQSADDDNYDIADFNQSVVVSGRSNKVSYLAGVNSQFTNGLSAVIDPNGNERDPFNKVSANVKVGVDFTKRFSVTTYANYDRFRADFDNSFPIEDADFSFISEQFRIGLTSVFKYNNGSINVNTAYNTVDRTFQSNFPSEFEGSSYVIDAFNKYNFNDQFYTVIGLNFIDNNATFSGDSDPDFNVVDPYANVVWISKFGLQANVGARLNNHSEYGSNFIYNINPSYVFKFNEESYFKILGSFSTSFIAPTLSQLFGQFGPNPDLEPEENRTIEGGVEYRVNDKLKISALYFNRNEENFIDFVTIDFVTFEGEFQNITDEFEVNGVEIELSAEPFENANFTANYTFTERKDQVALRIPRHKANASFIYNFSENTSASLNYQFTGERIDTNFATFENENLSSFSVFDLYFSHQLIATKLKVFASLNNVFNEEFVEVIGFTTRGRNARIGLLLNL